VQAPKGLTNIRVKYGRPSRRASASAVSSAALEDYYHVTAPWRARYAAASMFNLRGTGDLNNNLIERPARRWRRREIGCGES